MLGGVVGQRNARKGASRVFDAFQNDRLNRHLMFVLFDELMIAMFPDIDWSMVSFFGRNVLTTLERKQ
jgi:sorting nexin-25